MKPAKHILLWIMLGIIFLPLAACRAATVKDAWAAEYNQSDQTFRRADSFLPYNEKYVFIKLANANSKTVLRVVLTNISTNEVQFDDEHTYKKANLVDGCMVIRLFTYDGKQFPYGTYQVDVYSQKTLLKSFHFRVE